MPGSRPRWVLPLAVTLVAATAIALVLPSFVNWHAEDDLRTMRWVLEYRSSPWAALLELHSLHDHVRPATLIATWAGAVVSDGAWWGPHAVLLLLQLAGLAGLGVLAARLAGNPWAGVAAAGLALTLAGYEALSGWNAWICTAGEVAFGLWGLVFLHRALGAGRWPLAAIALLVVAGLFKEPGWLIYPLAGLALTWNAWREGRRGWPLAGALLSLPIGGVGLAVTWHPANVYRTAEAPTPWIQRAMDAAGDQGRALVDLWPLHSPAELPWWSGLSLPLIVLALFHAARRWRDLPVGAVLALLGLGVMLPFEGVNPVQVLVAGYGLCLLAGAAIARARRGAPLLLGLAVLGGVHEAAEIGIRLATLEPRPAWLANRVSGDRFLGEGAFAASIGAGEAVLQGPLEAQVLAPLIGLQLREDAPLDGVDVVTNGRLGFRIDDRSLRDVLLHDDLLEGRILPLVRPRSEHRRRPGGRGPPDPDAAAPGGLSVDGMAPGFLALGVVLEPGAVAPLAVRVEARDACGGEHVLAEPVTPWAVTTLRLRARCAPLHVSWSGAERGLVERVFLAPLPEPELSLWGTPIGERRLATPEQRAVPPIFEGRAP